MIYPNCGTKRYNYDNVLDFYRQLSLSSDCWKKATKFNKNLYLHVFCH